MMKYQRAFASWLGITDQQSEVMTVINRLSSKGDNPTPKAIGQEYELMYGKSIRSPNLFAILRALTQNKYLMKNPGGGYFIELDEVKKSLETKKKEIQTTYDDLDDFSTHLDTHFNAFSKEMDKPFVEYLEHTSFFEKIGVSAKTSQKLFAVGKFANITYTPELIERIDRGNCFKTIRERCFIKKRLKVTYITSFDVGYLYTHCNSVFGDEEIARKECEEVILGLENLSKNKMLDLLYTENLPGLHLVLTEEKYPRDVFLYLRDKEDEILGGVYMRSKDIANQAKTMFLQESRHATRLSDDTNKIIKILMKRLSSHHKKQIAISKR